MSASVVVFTGSKTNVIQARAEIRAHHPLAGVGAEDDADRLPDVVFVLGHGRRPSASSRGGNAHPTPRNAFAGSRSSLAIGVSLR